MSEQLKFGDQVEWCLDGDRDRAFVIGVPKYSAGYEDVVMVTSGDAWGMPINAAHLTLVGEPDVAYAKLANKRYAKQFPGFIRAERAGRTGG